MSEGSVPKPMTFPQSCAFQYANPKAWMMVIATTSTYASGGSLAQQIAIVCTPFFFIGLASTWSWAWAGSALTAWLKAGTRLAWFNRIMALSLAATALWMTLS
jgi:threonine/homoserine/homoserine lactone efflux protein